MNIFAFIKEKVAIWDVVNEYATLKKAGLYWKACCPFHHEKTASFTVSPHKEIFYCFGCHAGGDVISFIAKIENCSQREAVSLLADRYNIELPQTLLSESFEENTKEKNNYYELCKLIAHWCVQNLSKAPSIMQYLMQRGFTKPIIEYFSLGYFPGGLQTIKSCIEYMKQYNVLLDDLIKANIMLEGKTVVYSPFEDRIIFPIKDHLGRFCGFGGRVFKDFDTRPKYYNSRENDYFAKGSLVFGLDLAKKSIQETGTVFLVEGYTDCLAMVQHNFPNTVATLGTACTLQHLKQLARYAQHINVLYDSDTAGQQAILRLTELCWQVNMELKVVQLPTGQDPSSFLAGNNNIEQYINQARDIFLFFIDSLSKNFTAKSLNEKVNLTRKLIETIQTIGDSLKQDILLQRASKAFDIPFESLKHELGNLNNLAPKEHIQPKNTQADLDVPTLEKRIFSAIINNVQLFNKKHETYLIDYMPAPLRDILQQLKTVKSTNNSIDFPCFFNSLTQDNQRYISKLLLENEEQVDQDTFEQLVVQLHKKQWKIIVQDVKVKLAQAKNEGNNEKVQEIVNNFVALKQKIMPNITEKPGGIDNNG